MPTAPRYRSFQYASYGLASFPGRVPARDEVPSPADPGRVHRVRHAVPLAGIVERALVPEEERPEVGSVRQQLVRQRSQQALGREPRKRADRGEEDVEVPIGPAQPFDGLGHRREALDLELDVCSGVAPGEAVEDVAREVVTPLVDPERGTPLDRGGGVDRQVAFVDRQRARHPRASLSDPRAHAPSTAPPATTLAARRNVRRESGDMRREGYRLDRNDTHSPSVQSGSSSRSARNLPYHASVAGSCAFAEYVS